MTAPDPRVGEIENRLNAATPGPWRVRECSPCADRGRLEVNIWDEPGNLLITNWCDDDEFHQPDAEFIAHSPSDVAYLLAELRKRDEALARVEDLAKYLDTLAPGDHHYAKLIRAAVTGDGA